MKQGEREGHGHGDPDHEAAAPAHRERDESDDRERRDQQVLDELVRLLLRRLAVVARDVDVHVGGEELRPQVLDLAEHPLGELGGVGAGALGEGDRDRLVLAAGRRRRRRRRRARARRRRRPASRPGRRRRARRSRRRRDGPARRRRRRGRPRRSCGRADRPRRAARGCRAPPCRAPCRTEAAWRAPVSCIQLMPEAAMRSGSGSTRTTRGWPPMSWARLASGTSDSSWASSAASGRSRSLVQPLPHRVRLRKGTSSIECSSMIGGIVPWRHDPAHRRLPLVDLDEAVLVRLVDLEADGHHGHAGPRRRSRCARRRARPTGSARSARRPGSRPRRARRRARPTITSTIGTRICGSSSRGVATSASAPRPSEATITSGVSLLSRKAWATRPAKPTRMAYLASPRAAATRTGAPSARSAGFVTTRSPASTPARTSTVSPSRAPVAIQRRRALPSTATKTPVRPPRSKTAEAGTVSFGSAVTPGTRSRAKRPARRPEAAGRSAFSSKRCVVGVARGRDRR